MADLLLNLQVAIAATAAGVLCHLGYFIRGDHITNIVKIIQAGVLLPSLASAALVHFGNFSLQNACAFVGIAYVAFLAGLFSSILIYRLFFHRLRRFPGPFGAKVSTIWHVAHLTKLNHYKLLAEAAETYGPFVRIGPNSLLLATPEAVPIVHNPRSKCIKSAAYEATLPLKSLFQTRNKAEHDRRRRVWDRGFSTKSLRDYEGRVASYNKLLVKQLHAFAGQPLDASKWMNYFSFDVMGDLAFGKSFNMLNTGEKHFAISLLHKGQRWAGIFTPLPWLMHLLTRIPVVSRDYWNFVNWCTSQVKERRKMKTEVPDIMSWLLSGEPMSHDPVINANWDAGDSRLIIVAGSDTTAATLTHALYHLAKEPIHVEKLRHEIGSLGPDTELNDSNLRDLKHLHGVIDETLRLHPPVPSGLVRVTPPEGLQIGDTFVPGNTNILVPHWALTTSSNCYQYATEFIPERWYSRQDLNIHPEAFAPFSMGRYGCIGKNLAYMELRAVLSSIVMEFDVSFAPGEDGSRLLNDTEDCFTMSMAPLMLKFTRRSIA